MRTPALFALLLAAAGAASAGEKEFDQVVRAVSDHYGTKPMHIPMMGMANFFVKTARPAGVSGFRIAVFDDLPSTDITNGLTWTSSLRRLALDTMHPTVETRSRGGGEAMFIFAGDVGKSTKLLIATFERSEATIVEVKVNPEALAKMLKDPSHLSKALGIGHGDHGSGDGDNDSDDDDRK